MSNATGRPSGDSAETDDVVDSAGSGDTENGVPGSSVPNRETAAETAGGPRGARSHRDSARQKDRRKDRPGGGGGGGGGGI